MYKALVHSHLDYFDTNHIPASNNQINLGVTLKSLMEKVERTQYQAALAITGTWQGTNRSKLYEELGWETLSLVQAHSPDTLKEETFAGRNFRGKKLSRFRGFLPFSRKFLPAKYSKMGRPRKFFPEYYLFISIFFEGRGGGGFQ